MRVIIHFICLALIYCSARGVEFDAEKFLKNHRDGVVGINLKISFSVNPQGRPPMSRSRVFDLQGTVVSSEGLVVTSRSMVEPSSDVNTRLSDFAYSDIVFYAEDNKAIKAVFVGKDDEFDLIFFMPVDSSKDFSSPVDLNSKIKTELLGVYYEFTRIPREQGGAALIKPITVTGSSMGSKAFIFTSGCSPGAPVFSVDGSFVGLGVRPLWISKTQIPGLLPAEVLRQAITRFIQTHNQK